MTALCSGKVQETWVRRHHRALKVLDRNLSLNVRATTIIVVKKVVDAVFALFVGIHGTMRMGRTVLIEIIAIKSKGTASVH